MCTCHRRADGAARDTALGHLPTPDPRGPALVHLGHDWALGEDSVRFLEGSSLKAQQVGRQCVTQ